MRTKSRRVGLPRPSALAYLCAVFVLWAAGAAEAQPPSAGHGSTDKDRVIRAPLASMWGTGDGMGVYHNVFADCDTLMHSYGRNAAWGRWVMPRSAVVVEVVAAAGGAELVFRCRSGSSCIAERVDGERALSEHRVLVSQRQRADRFIQELGHIEATCRDSASTDPATPDVH